MQGLYITFVLIRELYNVFCGWSFIVFISVIAVGVECLVACLVIRHSSLCHSSYAYTTNITQAIYLIFAEYVDILSQIIYAKFKNDTLKDNRNTGFTKMEKNIKKHFREGFQQSVFPCCITVQCPHCYHLLSGYWQ